MAAEGKTENGGAKEKLKKGERRNKFHEKWSKCLQKSSLWVMNYISA